jgi:uncharacterized membrane protein YeaQ/YmgE (transglycosylase-associated protein family)
MSVWEFLFLLLVAFVCGGLAQAITGYSRGGCLVSIAIGFIGALLGMWLQKLTGAPDLLTIQFDETRFPVVWSLIGAVLFVAVVGFLTPRRPRRYGPP